MSRGVHLTGDSGNGEPKDCYIPESVLFSSHFNSIDFLYVQTDPVKPQLLTPRVNLHPAHQSERPESLEALQKSDRAAY